MTYFMGIDQYGQHYDDLGKHPRKELLRRLKKGKAHRMYCDKKDGACYHVGYIIAGLWITLYRVILLERRVN